MRDFDPITLADAIRADWRSQARHDQLTPEGDWFGWLILAGRGWGKTRTGAEFIVEQKRRGCMVMGLVGSTSADVRDVMIEGLAGIMRCAPAYDRPDFQPSNRCLEWSNGAKAYFYSAEEPNRLRGPQFEAVWMDELAAFADPQAVWDMLGYCLRVGRPKVVITTTPRPLPIVKDLMERKSFIVTRGSTYDNRANLADAYFENVIAPREGTRLGKQEIFAEILTDTPGALWTLDMIERARVRERPTLRRIVVALDPAVTSGATSDLTGIIAVGLGADDGHAYVLADVSGKYSPLEWSMKAIALYWKLGADRLVAESNMGGDMIEASLRNVDANVSYKGIPARVGKIGRAEPVAAIYEQGRCHHVGLFPELEAEMCGYTPTTKKSPDRMDALVHAIAELMLGATAGGALIEYMKRAVAEIDTTRAPVFGFAFTDPARGKTVRFIAPDGVSTVMLLSGTTTSPDPHGVVTCQESDALSLRLAGWREAPPLIEGELVS
jgi:phage terminase large subunit-like protein